jgi:hypothetical protein
LKVTSGGIDSGAEPILDWHAEVVAKVLDAAGAWKAGNRKAGMESEVAIEAEARRWTHRRCAGTNIVVVDR